MSRVAMPVSSSLCSANGIASFNRLAGRSPGRAGSRRGRLQLAYARDRAERALGDAFDIRDFHQQVLGTGALPLDVLEAKIDRWLAEAAQ